MSFNQIKLSTRIITEQKKYMTTKIVGFCAKDVRPMEIVSGEGFKSLAQHFVRVGATLGNIDISTILPHPTTISRHVADLKKESLKKLFPIIENAIVNGECSSTTDMWTDDYKKNHFQVMTVHYFDDNFVLNKNVLFTSQFKDTVKSGENIMKDVESKFELLGYKREHLKKIRFVTDHGSNMVKALKGRYKRDDCRAHRLNTILKNTFEDDDIPLIFSKILNNCKNIVRYLKQSGKSNRLKSAVVQECDSRWNTKLGMLESVIEQYASISELLTEDQRSKWSFDVDFAQEMVRFLSPFREATKSLEGDTYPTACKVLLWWENISKHLNEKNFTGLPFKKLIRIAKKYFQSKYPVDMDTKIACFLDPKYRFLKMLTVCERNEVFDEIKRLIELEELPQPRLEDDLQPPPAKKSRFSIFEESADDAEHFDEFKLYMQMASYSEYLDTKYNKTHSVELFWRNNKNKFPKLSKLAKKRLNVPATSAPSERIFSSAGRVLDSRRTNLKPQLLDDLLFLKENLVL